MLGEPVANQPVNPLVPQGVTLSSVARENPSYVGELNNPQADSSLGMESTVKKQESSAWDHLTDLSDMIKK